MKIAIIFLFIFILLTSGCISQTSIKESAIAKCISLCKQKKDVINLSHGPCLSNNIENDWVCDVAHSPRLPIDNLKENQCPSFGINASHFVEVDEQCNFIRAV